MKISAAKLIYYISCINDDEVDELLVWLDRFYPDDVIPGSDQDKYPGRVVDEFNTWIDGYREGILDG